MTRIFLLERGISFCKSVRILTHFMKITGNRLGTAFLIFSHCRPFLGKTAFKRL